MLSRTASATIGQAARLHRAFAEAAAVAAGAVLRAEPGDSEGLGAPPPATEAVAGLLAFNSEASPYARAAAGAAAQLPAAAAAIENLAEDVEGRRRAALARQRGVTLAAGDELAAAPASVAGGEGARHGGAELEDYGYRPALSALPEMQLPDALPGLGAAADISWSATPAPSSGGYSSRRGSAAVSPASAAQAQTAPEAPLPQGSGAPPPPPPPTNGGAPPPPPPPPPPPGAGAPPPPPPPPPPSAAAEAPKGAPPQQEGRSALLDSIRNHKKNVTLKKADERDASTGKGKGGGKGGNKAPSSGDARGDLLASIRSGVSLKSVKDGEGARPTAKAPPTGGGGGGGQGDMFSELVGSIMRRRSAIAERRPGGGRDGSDGGVLSPGLGRGGGRSALEVLDEAVSDETVGLTAGVQGLDQFLASQDDGSDGSDWD